MPAFREVKPRYLMRIRDDDGRRTRGFDRCMNPSCRRKVRYGVILIVNSAAGDGEGNYLVAEHSKGKIIIYCRACSKARCLTT